MGMSYHEIQKKFDEIVAFAGIEKFLDTQIKKYSSGMFMRLGFAIAAHLDADLLIIDEVLAVGDAQFQEKCIKKMNEIEKLAGKHGSLVSHHINSVLSLCNKGILLEKGELKAFEPIEECVTRYVQSCPTGGLDWKGDAGDEHIRFHRLSIDPPDTDAGFFCRGDQTKLNLEFEVLKPQNDLMLSFSVLNGRYQVIARSPLMRHCQKCRKASNSVQTHLGLFHPGEYRIRLESSLFNRKKILEDDVVVKFAVYSQDDEIRHEFGVEKEGISLGNGWQ